MLREFFRLQIIDSILRLNGKERVRLRALLVFIVGISPMGPRRLIATRFLVLSFTDAMTENCALLHDSIKVDPTDFGTPQSAGVATATESARSCRISRAASGVGTSIMNMMLSLNIRMMTRWMAALKWTMRPGQRERRPDALGIQMGRAVLPLDGWSVITNYVAAGVGISFVPDRCLTEHDRLWRVSFEGAARTRRYGAMTRRDASLALAAREFLSVMVPGSPGAP